MACFTCASDTVPFAVAILLKRRGMRKKDNRHRRTVLSIWVDPLGAILTSLSLCTKSQPEPASYHELCSILSCGGYESRKVAPEGDPILFFSGFTGVWTFITNGAVIIAIPWLCAAARLGNNYVWIEWSSVCHFTFPEWLAKMPLTLIRCISLLFNFDKTKACSLSKFIFI